MGAVDPSTERITRAMAADRNRPVGVNAFKNSFIQEASAKAYMAWTEHEITRLFRGVIQDLLVNGPSYGVGSDMIPVHYGMTLAFSLVTQLLEHPELVIPGMFALKDGCPPQKKLSDIHDDYSTSVDDVLGKEKE